MEVNAKVLKTLVEIMQRDGLDRLRVRVGGVDVDLRMSLPEAAPAVVASAPAASTDATRPAAAQAAVSQAPPNVRRVTAPLVGVFYRSPAPGAQPFVQLGDRIAAGQVLCILEAMKLMNEIVSEHDGTIVKICANDGDLVAIDQELYWIEP